MGKITIRDVAREAGVSISLVSLVMNAKRDAEGNLDCNVNKDTARRIAEVAKRLGYRPNKAAASLRSGRFYTIGMVTSDIANQFFADIARYIENIAHNYNYTVLFGSSDENAEKLDNIVDTFIGNGVEGLIVAPCSGSEEVLRKALDAGIPTVLLDRDIAGLDVGRVMLDNERAGRMGVEHLYENGYRRIEMISYTLGISSLSERERGYCEAMRRYGLEGYSQIHYTVYGHAQEDTVRIFEDAVRRGVEAFLLPTNTLALLGLQALNALNLSAPEDLALVGFDESESFSLYKPSVTYITQSTRRLGEQSFEMLRRMIAGDDDCRSVVIEPELIVGGSTACIHPERVEAGREHAAGVAELTPRDSVLLPGTYFRHKGGWTADPQFMEQMGSSYLLAHGLGTPVEDAVTKIEIPQSGQYRIFVRTKNWTAHWADKEKHAPGAFRLRIDGRDCDTLFGTGDPEWHWQAGGTTYLTEGVHQVALHDLAGFDARCDAILFTLHDVAPDDSLETVFRLRNNLLGLPAEPEERGTFDFVVAGGGVAGMCAAIAAARQGLRVALIQDRKVLGGNNSSEVRVGLGGRLNIGAYPSLGYLLNEFGPSTKGNARTPEVYEDEKKLRAILAEERITLLLGYKVTKVNKRTPRTIESVVATDVDTYRQIVVRGPLFADCTGDATLGVLAGAEWSMGREARSKYGEPSAPDTADGMTMGASVQWYCLEADAPTAFPDIEWGLPIDERSVQIVRRGQWYWEVGMRDDQIADAEKIRDYGMYVAYSNWSYLKNRSSVRDRYANSYLGWVAHVAGKRESRRLLGEFVLREQDLMNFTIYPDGTASTSWYIDQHYPDPENSKLFPGREYLSCGHLTPLSFYPIPYRCFYSKDIDNLFMAGRNISVSHVALGTVRVMRTTAMMGEVVGMAASICSKHGALPHDVYDTRFEELRELMQRGAGRTDVPYLQVYTLIDTTAARSEEC